MYDYMVTDKIEKHKSFVTHLEIINSFQDRRDILHYMLTSNYDN